MKSSLRSAVCRTAQAAPGCRLLCERGAANDRAAQDVWLHLAATAIVLAVVVFLSSCGRQDRLSGYVYYRLNADPTTLDPALIVDVTGGTVAAKIFNGLVRLDDQLRVIPDLAVAWERLENGLTHRFRLRAGVRFSNGREVTAEDVVYSFRRILDPKTKSPNTWVLDRIRGAREFMRGSAAVIPGLSAPDRHTVVIELAEPFSPFLNLLTMTAAYIVPREEVELRGSDFSSYPVGTGPFLLEEWRRNTQVLLKRNERYFGGAPKVAGIGYRIIPEDLTALTEFELGNIDVITVPSSEYSRYRASPRWSPLIASMPGLNTYYLGFNCSRPPFDAKALRKAVSMAVDREKILRTFFEGRGRLAAGPVPDLLRTWNLPLSGQYDPVASRRIVGETGAGEKEIQFYVLADREVLDMAEIIQAYLNGVGLRVRIRQLEWSAYKEAVSSGEADMFWLSWWADYPDPENFLFPLFHSSNHGASGNRTRYTNHAVDSLIEAGQRAVSDAERDRRYREAEVRIVDDAPWVCFWHKTDYVARQPSLKHFRIYPIYSMDKGLEVAR